MPFGIGEGESDRNIRKRARRVLDIPKKLGIKRTGFDPGIDKDFTPPPGQLNPPGDVPTGKAPEGAFTPTRRVAGVGADIPPPPPRTKGLPGETFLVTTGKDYAVGQDNIPGTELFLDDDDDFTVVEKEPIDEGEQNAVWQYEFKRTRLYEPVTLDEGTFPRELENYDQIVDLQEGGASGTNPKFYWPAPDFYGSPQDIVAAKAGIIWTVKNLQGFRDHAEDKMPELIDGITNVHEPEEGGSTLDKYNSALRAANDIIEEHPDDYTQYMASEAGVADLWERSFRYYLTPKQENEGLLEKGLKGVTKGLSGKLFLGGFLGEEFVEERIEKPIEGLLESTSETPVGDIELEGERRIYQGLSVNEWGTRLIEKYFPDIPWVKPTLERTAEMMTPEFVGLMALLALPGGKVALASRLARNGRLMLEIAGGMAVTEDAVERVGLPGEIGLVAGGFFGPAGVGAAKGFTRATIGERLWRGKIKPTWGEPATELSYSTVRGGAIPDEGLQLPNPEIFQASKVVPTERGTVAVGRVDTMGVGIHTEGAKATDAIGLTISRAPGEEKRVLAFRSLQKFIDDLRVKNPFRPIDVDVANPKIGNLLRRKYGAVETETPHMLRVAPLEGRPYMIAGGESSVGPVLADLDEQVFVHLTRPEAQDTLRKLGAWMHKWPGGKRITEIINRMGGQNIPATLKGALGEVFLQNKDNAFRKFLLARLRNPPFKENHKTQIQLTGKGGKKFWIAQGDLFEDITRGLKGGQSKYMELLNESQIDYIKLAQETREGFIKHAEKLTGEKIMVREAHWPRFRLTEKKRWVISEQGPAAKPSGFYRRSHESMEEAITDKGITYKPGIVDVLDAEIAGFQKINRRIVLNQYLKREGIIRDVKKPSEIRSHEVSAREIVPPFKGIKPGVISINHLDEMRPIMGAASKNPLLTGPVRINSVLRLMLTGLLDTGVGSLQLQTLFFVDPHKWGEAMGRSLYGMVRPSGAQAYYQFISQSPAAAEFARYGGNIGLHSEFFEAAKLIFGRHPQGRIGRGINFGTTPLRTFVNRMELGFDSALAYGRIFMFDALSDAAKMVPQASKAARFRQGRLLGKVPGFTAKPLEGEAYHQEMYRLARFVDTAIGQPELTGVISKSQHQFEAAYIWFATRYTRSILGTASYMFGKGYTPAQARQVLTKMFLGGQMAMAGFIAAKGEMQGLSGDEILSEIKTALDPRQGKKYMAINLSQGWFGMGGAYRSGMVALGSLAEADNWQMGTWSDRVKNNPFVRMWRGRTPPATSSVYDFLLGEDYLGRNLDFWEMVDNPAKYRGYFQDNMSPFALDAVLQDGNWMQRTSRGVTEFFGLRSSQETAFEAMKPVMDKLAQEKYDVDNFDDLKHNLPAQDEIREHPDILAIEEGRAGQLLEREEEKQWRIYREERDKISEDAMDKKEEEERRYINGDITGSQLRARNRAIAAEEFHKLEGVRQTMLAGLGLDVTEAGDDEPPKGSVNAALNEYYSIEVDDYKDDRTGQVDWDSLFADRDAALSQVDDKWKPLVEEWLSRSQVPIIKDFRQKFDNIIEPSGYFTMREQVAELLDIDLQALETEIIDRRLEEGLRTAPSDVGKTVEQALDLALKEQSGLDNVSVDRLQELLRESKPRLDVELYRQGYTGTVRSPEAVELAKRFNNARPELGYATPELAKDVEQRLQ